MKKFILIMILGLFVTSVQGQTQWYKATEFSFKIATAKTWSDWVKIDINVKVDVDNDLITIYSKEPQLYRIIEKGEVNYKKDQVRFKIIDQDGDIGYIRFREESEGNIQIYIDFSDISWAYNLY